jgi:hypothetical protein
MRHNHLFAFALAAAVVCGPLVGAASAQSSPPPATAPGDTSAAPAPPPAGAAPGAPSTPDAGRQAIRDQIKATRSACRDEADAQGLKGTDLKQHVRDCFAAKMPQVAKRIECRREAQAKGVTQPALRDYVKQCLASKS